MKKPNYFRWKSLLRPSNKLILSMKLIPILMLVFFMNTYAEVHSQQITLNKKEIKMTDLFLEIKKQTGYDVISQTSIINHMKLSVNFKAENLKNVLDQVLKLHHLDYVIENKAIIVKKEVAKKTIPSQASNSADHVNSFLQRIFKGKLLDAAGKGIEGATIQIKDKNSSTQSDKDGHFTIMASLGDEILIRSLGYQPTSVKLSENSILTLTLLDNVFTVDEVVVVGFGTQKKRNLTGAVGTVDTKVLENRPVTNLSQALQGTVPGLNITSNALGGQLGQTMNVNIRGAGTIGTGSSASALILIDGIEGNINNLNADDIESISVLKDASAASVYGSRAAFGVILITTKKGKAGHSTISYTNNFRNSGPINMPTLLNSYDFANYFNEASVNGGGQAIFDANTIERIQQFIKGEITTTTIPNEGNGNWQFHEKANDNVNWYDVHYKRAWSQENNINFNGGSEKIQYYASGNYLNQNGNLRYGEDNYKRFNTMAKINAKLNPFVDINVTSRFTRTKLDNPYYSDMGGLLYHDIERMWPMMPFKDPNGNYMRNGKLAQLTNGSRSITNNDNIYLQGQLVIHPVKDWNIYLQAGLRTINENNQSNINPVYEYNVKGDPLLLQFDGSRTAGATEANQFFLNQNMYTTSIYSDYEKRIGHHYFKGMLGMNTEMLKYRNLGAMRPGLFSSLIPEISAAGGTDKITSATVYDWSTAGFFGRLNYDFKNRYLLEVNLRYDGSSRFLNDQRWSWFPSFSLGWNAAEEDFIKNNSTIFSVIKPRISWGQLGNQNTNLYYPFYLTQPITVNGGNWLINGVKPTVSYVPGTISESLTWEKVKNVNAGLDIAAFKNRLDVNFDYYIRTTDGMVGPAAEIGAVYGTGLPNTNNSILDNKGWELQVNWRDKINTVGYSIGVNLSDNKVSVKKYPNESRSLSTYYDGQVLGEIWGYETQGIAHSHEEMTSWLTHNKPTWGANWGEGDIMYKDLNGDNEVNSGANTLDNPGDRRIIGNSTPRYNFGIHIGLNWKGFDFFTFIQGVAKRDVWLSDPNFWGVGSGQWQSTGLEGHLDYYRPENTTSVFGANTQAYYPKIYLGNSMNQQVQTQYLQSGAYARLKNVQLGYTLPAAVLSKVKIQRMRIYVSGENLLTWSKISKIYDPEATNGPYGNGKTYPLSSTISFGTSLTF